MLLCMISVCLCTTSWAAVLLVLTMASLEKTVKEQLRFGKTAVLADDPIVTGFIETVIWEYNTARFAASCVQMPREGLMAVLGSAFQESFEAGYEITNAFATLHWVPLPDSIQPKRLPLATLKSHQDKASYAHRGGLRFTSSEEPQNIVFSDGRLDDSSTIQQKYSVPLHSSHYYVASKDIMKHDNPHNLFHAVLAPNPGTACLVFLVDMQLSQKGVPERLRLPQNTRFLDDLTSSDLPAAADRDTCQIPWRQRSVQLQCLQEGCKSELARLTLAAKNVISKSQTLTACRLDCAALHGQHARQKSISASCQHTIPSNV